jgi:trans-aconitate methyltransferase
MPSTTETTAVTGSAERWGPLWGARPADWALSEDQQTPTYEATLERVDLKAGQAVLEIGCGAGSFLRLVAERGARAFGLDASQALIESPGRPRDTYPDRQCGRFRSGR